MIHRPSVPREPSMGLVPLIVLCLGLVTFVATIGTVLLVTLFEIEARGAAFWRLVQGQ